MRKKSLTYATVAVLLGVVMMLAPFLSFSSHVEVDTYGEQVAPRNFAPERWQELSAKSEVSAGVTPHYPVDAIFVGLMLTFSLVFAFIVSSQLKKGTA